MTDAFIETQSSLARSSGQLSGLRVLLAEDSWHVANAMKNLLETEGAIVSGPAPTIDKAIELAGEGADAIVADLNLRGELALGMIEELSRRGFPVIVVTGYEVANDLKESAFMVLRKPIRAEVLISNLRAIMDAKYPTP